VFSFCFAEVNRCWSLQSAAAMAVAWEKLTTEGVQFTYDALPALGGGFSLGAALQSPVTEALVPRSAGDAALDTLARSDAVPLVTTRPCTLLRTLPRGGAAQFAATSPGVVMYLRSDRRTPAVPTLKSCGFRMAARMTAARRRWEQLLRWTGACSASSRPWRTTRSAAQQRATWPLQMAVAPQRATAEGWHQGSCRGQGRRAASAARCCDSTMVISSIEPWHHDQLHLPPFPPTYI